MEDQSQDFSVPSAAITNTSIEDQSQDFSVLSAATIAKTSIEGQSHGSSLSSAAITNTSIEDQSHGSSDPSTTIIQPNDQTSSSIAPAEPTSQKPPTRFTNFYLRFKRGDFLRYATNMDRREYSTQLSGFGEYFYDLVECIITADDIGIENRLCSSFSKLISPLFGAFEMLFEFWAFNLDTSFSCGGAPKIAEYYIKIYISYVINHLFHDLTGCVAGSHQKIRILNGLNGMSLDGAAYLWERYKAGLLRETQVKIITKLIHFYVESMGDFFTEYNRSKSEPVLCLMGWTTSEMLRQYLFISSPCFRSERLELLLWKYLDEDEVNMDVVRGIRLLGTRYRGATSDVRHYNRDLYDSEVRKSHELAARYY